MMGGAHFLLLWLTLSFLSLPTISATSAYPSAPSSNFPSVQDLMAIQTRTSTVKARAAKADVPAAIRPSRRKTRSASQSPTGKSVTAHLAALNLPGSQFDGVLTVLGHDGHKDQDDGRDLEVPVIDKSNKYASPDSPAGVEDGISMPTLMNDTASTDKQAQPVVRITERSPSPSVFESPSTSDDRVARGSVLKNPSKAPTVVDEPATTRQPLQGLEQGSNYVIDRPNKLYIVYNETGQETRFHVEDFVGLFPSWPIIELSIAPTGSTKDERMTNFVQCFAALLAGRQQR